MATVLADMTMSLDGFIADPHDEVGPLFDWFQAGPVTTPSASEQLSFQTDEASAEQLRDALTSVGALICGRRLFDLTNAWGGRHPIGCPVVVVTHTVPDGWPRDDAPFTFVTDGIESAVAQAKALAGDKIVAVSTPTITQQCLNAGLLDAIRVNLAPVLLGEGIRFFDKLRDTPMLLEDPTVTPGTHVTHLYYRVQGH
ncbi:MAG TPA: dihydrofolate reductase family protein [Ktedonobacterales bacterium]|nr:dihydrofolate reductase family protein [Ktedonobacterales bacterium]